MQVACPACGASSSRVPAELAGRVLRCPRCQSRFRAPLPGDEAQPTVPEAAASAAGHDTLAAPTVAEPQPNEPQQTPSTATREWAPGDTVLGLYEVVAVLGQGGMGRVYRVRHRGWGLDLALKVPLASVLAESGGAELFVKEAETWVNLGLHPHVVTCHYVRRLDGLPLVFAEYADGGSVHEAIKAGRLATPEAILDVAVQFAWGLHHAHEQGLVHRDVKPANVMLTSDGLAKVTDFGLARARPGRLAAGAGGGHTMTVEGGGGATPAYVSPEQARGDTLSRRSDAWSFGLSLLEMFLGRRTWKLGLAAPEVLAAIDMDRPATPLPADVRALLERCFRPHADERPHDMAEIAAELRAAWEALTGRSYPRAEPKGGSGSPDALNNRAASLVDLGREHEATGLWARALQAEPLHLEATYNAALHAWRQAKLADPELVRRVEQACAPRGGSPRAEDLLGRIRSLVGARVPGATERGDTTTGTESARTLRGLAGTVSGLAATPDGALVAAASGRELRVWRAHDGELVQTLAVDGPVRALLALADSRSLVVAAEGAPLAVWDVVSGRSGRSFARQAGVCTSLAHARGGTLVASGGSDRVVRLWDPASGRCLRELPGHEDAVTAVAAGDVLVASASRDGSLRLFSLDDGACLGVLRAHEGRVLAVALREGDSRVVSAGEDGTVCDWGLRSREVVRRYVSHALGVSALALSADGRLLVSGSADRTLRGFDPETETLRFVCRLDSAIQALAPAADGRFCAGHGSALTLLRPAPLVLPRTALCRPATASEEDARATAFAAQVAQAQRSIEAGDLATAFHFARTARSVPGHERAAAALVVWDEVCARLPRSKLLSTWELAALPSQEDTVLAVAVDAAGARVATAALDATVRCWDVAARRLLHVFSGHVGAVTGIAFAAGGAQLVSCGRDRTVRLWDAASGTPLAVLEGHGETVADVDVAPGEGALAATAGADGSVRLWNLKRRCVTGLGEGHTAPVASVRFSPDGQVVASAGWDGTLRLWDAETAAPLGSLAAHEGNATAVAWHPSGRQLASGGEDRQLVLHDPRTRRRLRVLAGHTAEISALAFTADGRFLLSASRDRTLRIWDLRQAETVATLSHPELVLGLALNAAASLLATAGDRRARLFHLDWEPEPQGTTRLATTRAASAPASTLRDDLRRAAPVAAEVPRAAARAARRVPWRWLALAAVVLASVLISARYSWWRPAAALRLSPLADGVRDEVDLLSLPAFVHRCAPDEYDQHLRALLSGNPDAHDVACVGARGSAAMVSDVLDAAPLAGSDPLATRRLRRNAASALTGAGAEAVPALCARLSDPRGEVRATVAQALGTMPLSEIDRCLDDVALSGSDVAKEAAASALRQRLARQLTSVEAGWAIVSRLLQDPAPAARRGGLGVVPLFGFAHADPAARALLSDPDPAVAAAARDACGAIASGHRRDQLGGRSEP